jgi:hypothetical protein
MGANLKMPYPVLLNTEYIVDETFGTTHTPSILILDGNGVLCYWCAVVNNEKVGGAGRQAFAEDATGALRSATPALDAQTREFGCAIRRTNY